MNKYIEVSLTKLSEVGEQRFIYLNVNAIESLFPIPKEYEGGTKIIMLSGGELTVNETPQEIMKMYMPICFYKNKLHSEEPTV